MVFFMRILLWFCIAPLVNELISCILKKSLPLSLQILILTNSLHPPLRIQLSRIKIFCIVPIFLYAVQYFPAFSISASVCNCFSY
jgi:hypothetical protein